MKSDWGLALVLQAAFLTCVVNWGKQMRPCIASTITLICLMNCEPMIGPVKFFFPTKCSANVSSSKSNLKVVVANNFSNWPIATCFLNLAGSSTLKILVGIRYLTLCNSICVSALAKAPGLTKASLVRLFLKSRGTYSCSSLRFKTTVEFSGRYISLVCSSLTIFFSMLGVNTVERIILLFPLNVVIVCLSASWRSMGNYWSC